jgi:DNA-directed RNA polymerase subunit M/transcription elongation factor TFIIS
MPNFKKFGAQKAIGKRRDLGVVGSNPIGAILFRMALKFCNKCGGIVRSKKIDKDKSYSFCDNCQEFNLIKSEDIDNLSFNEKMEEQKNKGKGFRDSGNEFADYPNICKKCGYDKAQIIDMGVFYSDEDNLILLRCGKCGFSERIGRKVS